MFDAQDNMKRMTEIVEQFSAGKSLKDMRNIDEKAMSGVYAIGYQYYQSARYEEAGKLFQWLCLYDHFNVKYFKALASTQFMLKQYEAAVNTYSACYFLDKDNPEYPLQSGLCHLALGNLDAAESGFYAASLWGVDAEIHAAINAKAKSMLELVKKKKVMKSTQAA